MIFNHVILIGVMSALLPGPDLILLIKNSLQSGRKSGIATSLGVAVALIIHIAYTILGFAIVLEHFPFLINIIKILGSAYLIWLGWNTLKPEPKNNAESPEEITPTQNSFKNSFYQGFMCNFLNPNSALFFLSVFSQLVNPGIPIYMSWLFGFIIIFIVAVFYVAFAYAISNLKFRRFYLRYKSWFDRSLGLILILFAFSIGLSVF